MGQNAVIKFFYNFDILHLLQKSLINLYWWIVKWYRDMVILQKLTTTDNSFLRN